MTQFHCEIHKYQLALRLGLPTDAHRELSRLRTAYPSDFFVLCNQKNTDDDTTLEMTIPELASGRRKTIVADIFHGMRPFEGEPGDHFFPWSRDLCRPAIEGIEVTIEHVVTFRPFAHLLSLPDVAPYLLFGSGDEAHMTNLQTARLATGPFEVEGFGPDYDHVLSLDGSTADWLDPALLEAGIVVTVPAVRLRDPATGTPTIPCDTPLRPDRRIELLYRGTGPAWPVTAGPSSLYCTAVCNSPAIDPCGGRGCHITEMPKKYWT
ncbi:hypothetical protein ACRDNQ_05150 [Palleronia sp. KMU-117]|uniref:hypothetical protein n=1 Tax=Palleronia sp. KMU-117 TaxID=3434108 RepID=UPI003D749386